jgi:hypothetical protein
VHDRGVVDFQDRIPAEELTQKSAAEAALFFMPSLPITMESVVAVIKAAAMIMMPIRNPEHAIHRANGAADTSADRAANHATYRTGHAIAFRRTFLRTADDALGVPDVGDGEQRKGERRGAKIKPGCRAGRQRRCLDFRHGLHRNSSGVAAIGQRDGYM